jgi:membrane-bound serine protease (ClpP class)
LLFTIGVALAFIYLDWPGRIAVIAILGGIEVFEIALWLRLRKMRSITGEEALVGAKGRAMTNCRPQGQVRLRGAIWTAHSKSGVAAGDEVVVTATQGLKLEVERA